MYYLSSMFYPFYHSARRSTWNVWTKWTMRRVKRNAKRNKKCVNAKKLWVESWNYSSWKFDEIYRVLQVASYILHIYSNGMETIRDRLVLYRQHINQPQYCTIFVEKHLLTCGNKQLIKVIEKRTNKHLLNS